MFFNFMAAVNICSDFGAAPQIKSLFLLFPQLFAMKWWDWMPWSSFFECWILSQLLHSLSLFIKRLLSPSLLSAIKEFIDISPENLDSRTAFHMMYSAYKLNKQGDKIQPWRTPFPIWNQSTVTCPVLTIASDQHTDFSGGRSGDLVFPSL